MATAESAAFAFVAWTSTHRSSLFTEPCSSFRQRFRIIFPEISAICPERKMVFPSSQTGEVEGKLDGVVGQLLRPEGKIVLIEGKLIGKPSRSWENSGCLRQDR